MEVAPFDQMKYMRINRSRKEFLGRFLPTLIREHDIKTALDVGCGFGYFSRYLADLGLQVTAVDARAENVAMTQRRNPDITLHTLNAEDPAVLNLGSYDLVLCLGLLYHLENPFLAVRNLETVTGKILVIKTMIAPSRSQVAILREEVSDETQSLNYVALLPSESWLLKCLYKSGFPFVYKTRELPSHEDFHRTLLRARKRTVLVASKVELEAPILKLVSEPRGTNRFVWYVWGLRHLLERKSVRRILHRGRSLVRSLR